MPVIKVDMLSVVDLRFKINQLIPNYNKQTVWLDQHNNYYVTHWVNTFLTLKQFKVLMWTNNVMTIGCDIGDNEAGRCAGCWRKSFKERTGRVTGICQIWHKIDTLDKMVGVLSYMFGILK